MTRISNAGQRHRYVYAAAALHETRNLPQQAISKLDTLTLELQVWDKGRHYYTGEPIFVPFPKGRAPSNKPRLFLQNIW